MIDLDDSTQSFAYSDTRRISELSKEERPREKAMVHGIESLTDAELMAILFGTGIKGMNVLEMCKQLLASNDNSLSMIAKLSVDEIISDIKGIGPAKAITLLAALQLGIRAQLDADMRAASESITSPETAYKLLKPKLQWLQHEEFWVLLINRAGKPIKLVKVSQGGTAATTVDVKLIMRGALKYSADSMILFHNHPSGTLKPSIEDDRLTNRIVEAARMLDLRVNDHIIVTDSGFYSYNEHGKI